jgi:hypothetical protein
MQRSLNLKSPTWQSDEAYKIRENSLKNLLIEAFPLPFPEHFALVHNAGDAVIRDGRRLRSFPDLHVLRIEGMDSLSGNA